MHCGKGDRIDRWFDLGRHTLLKELTVQRLVRSMRMIESYIEKEIPGEIHAKIKQDTKKMELLDSHGDL